MVFDLVDMISDVDTETQNWHYSIQKQQIMHGAAVAEREFMQADDN